MFSVLLNFLSLLSYVISHEMTVHGELDRVEEEVVTAYFNIIYRIYIHGSISVPQEVPMSCSRPQQKLPCVLSKVCVLLP
jgi:hypothetical protein